MFRSDDIQPVTDFVRNHKRHHQHLRATGRPEVLTINGTPELVVQDVRAYEREADEARRLREENRALRERLEELEADVEKQVARLRQLEAGGEIRAGCSESWYAMFEEALVGLRTLAERRPYAPERQAWGRDVRSSSP
jgi:PHD/YefM family antitoxin component YafN of YafNO toxin-antitoxin module